MKILVWTSFKQQSLSLYTGVTISKREKRKMKSHSYILITYRDTEKSFNVNTGNRKTEEI